MRVFVGEGGEGGKGRGLRRGGEVSDGGRERFVLWGKWGGKSGRVKEEDGWTAWNYGERREGSQAGRKGEQELQRRAGRQEESWGSEGGREGSKQGRKRGREVLGEWKDGVDAS